LNENEVTVKDNVRTALCLNGEGFEDAMNLPATGGIGLEADRGQMEYRRLRLKENAVASFGGETIESRSDKHLVWERTTVNSELHPPCSRTVTLPPCAFYYGFHQA